MSSNEIKIDDIPVELREARRWAPWEAVWDENRGKYDKVPHNPKNPARGLSTNKPDKWADLDTAFRACQQAGLAGIGYLMTGEHGIVRYDLDDCFEGSELKEWAQMVVDRLDTYTEISPSGRGLRLFCKGSVPRDWNNHSIGIECYGGHAARFLTITTRRFPNTPGTLREVEDSVHAEILSLYGKPASVSVELSDLPDLIPEDQLPDLAELKLSEKVLKFLTDGENDGDGSRMLFTAGCELVARGLADDVILSIFATNPYAWDVAMSHRRQDEDRAMAYLWKEQVLRARVRAVKVTGVSDEFEELAAPEGEAYIDEINRAYCFAWAGAELQLMKAIDSKGYSPSSIASLKTFYANKPVIAIGHDGKRKAVNPVDLWITSAKRREYAGVEFAPGRPPDDRILNLWGGWAIEPRNGDVSMFLELTNRIIFGSSPELAAWGLNWAAHIFQKPDELPGKAILLQSGQGVGKNTWIDTICVPLGPSFIQVSSHKGITGDFNAHLANKLLVHAAESVWGGDKSKVGPIKAMVTDEHQSVEHKGKDVFSVRNYKRLILSSNEDWPVPMDKDDRRFVVSKCVKAYGGNDPFWREYKLWLANGGANFVFGYLLNRDISNFRPWERVDAINSGWDIKIQSSDALTKWWYDVLSNGDAEEQFQEIPSKGNWLDNHGSGWALAISRQHFWSVFETWAHRTGARHIPEVMHRKRILTGLCPSMKDIQVSSMGRKFALCFPTLAQCRDEFARALGADARDVFRDAGDFHPGMDQCPDDSPLGVDLPDFGDGQIVKVGSKVGSNPNALLTH